jgi:hypothetical protein
MNSLFGPKRIKPNPKIWSKDVAAEFYILVVLAVNTISSLEINVVPTNACRFLLKLYR